MSVVTGNDALERALQRALSSIPAELRLPILNKMLGRRGQQRKRRGFEDDGVPVEPISPKGLQGGAAVALDFDED